MQRNMNDNPLNEKWRELSWRQKLTDCDENELRAFLAAHPEARLDWEDEAGLNKLLQQLPDAPVPSNFTARVLQAVERESIVPSRARFDGRAWWLRIFAPRAAVAAVVLGMGLFAWHHHQVERRIELARSITMISKAGPLPSPEVLANFDAIRHLSQTPAPDEELLALLK